VFRRKLLLHLTALSVVMALAGMLAVSGAAQAVPSVRGFDGSTIKVASIGIKGQLPNVEVGAKARIKRFNDDNEIKGIKIDYTEFAEDHQDVATTLSETRRLVTETGVFALVGDVSATNPGAYLNQQHVPYFGWAFDDTYCSNTPTTKLYGFGFNGCLVPSDPAWMPNNGRAAYAYVSKLTGKRHPTAALFSADNQSGKASVQFQASSYQGAGFNVVYNKAAVPEPPVADYTPYTQDLLQADSGNPPDIMVCLLAAQCLPMYAQIVANNYKGTFLSSFAQEGALAKPFKGAVSNSAYVWPTQNTTGVTQMKKDVEAVSPGAPIDSGTLAGYLSTDMFIAALKTIAKKGKSNITPENLQKTAANQTWQIKGLAGPTSYPKSTVGASPACNTLVADQDGTTWTPVVPFACSSKEMPILPKFKNS
jgi:branched-chain amino acid transport system substrate-binding protein